MAEKYYVRNRYLISIQSLLMIGSITAILGLMGWLIGGTNFLYIVVIGIAVAYIFNPAISPALTMKMYHGRKLAYAEAPGLYNALRRLARRAGLEHVPTLYYLPSRNITAWTTGTGRDAVIGISRHLLDHLNMREVTAVLAHEISHIRNKDTRVMGFAGLANHVTHMLSIVGQFFLFINLPLMLLKGYVINWGVILLLIVAPHISILIQMALSRTREYAADLSAAQLTGEPLALANALAKIEYFQKRASQKIFRLPYTRSPEDAFMRTHPPIEKRIQRLREYSGNRQPSQVRSPRRGWATDNRDRIIFT